MTLDELHGKYLEALTNSKISEFKEYEMKRLLFNESYYACTIKFKRIFKLLASVIMKKQIECQYKDSLSKILAFTFYYNRQDHDSYWDSFLDVLGEYDKIEVKYKKNASYFSIKENFERFHKVFQFYKQLFKIRNVYHRLYLAARLMILYDFKNCLDTIVKNDYKILVTFFDSGFFENLITQFANNRGIKTITLQHGQPVFKSYDNDRVNQSVILNLTSNYTICNGQFSKEQYLKAGYDENRLITLGSLKKVDSKKDLNVRKGTFCVFLDTPLLPSSEQSNKKLLDLAVELSERTGMKFYVKPHPNDVETYEDIEQNKKCIEIIRGKKSINEFKNLIDFGVFYASSIYVDMLSCYIKPFKMNSQQLMSIVTKEEDIFDNIEDLITKVSLWYKKDGVQKREYFDDLIEYYLNPFGAKERYNDFINSLLE